MVHNSVLTYYDILGLVCNCPEMCKLIGGLQTGLAIRAAQITVLDMVQPAGQNPTLAPNNIEAAWQNLEDRMQVIGVSGKRLGINDCADEWETSKEANDHTNSHLFHAAWMLTHWNRENAADRLLARRTRTMLESERARMALKWGLKIMKDKGWDCKTCCPNPGDIPPYGSWNGDWKGWANGWKKKP